MEKIVNLFVIIEEQLTTISLKTFPRAFDGKNYLKDYEAICATFFCRKDNVDRMMHAH